MASADLLSCSLCLGEYEDPRALPCLHTYCLKCLIQLRQSNPIGNTMRCPICQEDHRLPANGVYGFRQDFRIKNLMEMGMPMAPIGPSVKNTMCQWHPEMEATLYCKKVGCNRAVLCVQCAEQSHRNHFIYPIKEICEKGLSDMK